MMPILLAGSAPLSTAAGAVSTTGSAIRLSVSPGLDRRGTVDRAWWPHSRGAAVALPGLVAAVDQRLGRTTLRIGLYRDA
ncbi:DUF5994 family protein [Nonomuraea sp. M3C6]|uniref:DUF5994 family protein n=1 Tax=Nonomuraea marmarensis TaxID=3351344 RepID=A0ABW7AL01_9ACTN